MSERAPWSDADVKELKDKIVNLFNAKEITNVEAEQAEGAARAPGKTNVRAQEMTELSARRILTHLNRKQRRAVAAERRAGLSLVAALKKLNLLPLTV